MDMDCVDFFGGFDFEVVFFVVDEIFWFFYFFIEEKCVGYMKFYIEEEDVVIDKVVKRVYWIFCDFFLSVRKRFCDVVVVSSAILGLDGVIKVVYINVEIERFIKFNFVVWVGEIDVVVWFLFVK